MNFLVGVGPTLRLASGCLIMLTSESFALRNFEWSLTILIKYIEIPQNFYHKIFLDTLFWVGFTNLKLSNLRRDLLILP